MPNYIYHPVDVLAHRWKGDAAGYHAMHYRVRKARGKAVSCIHRQALGCTSMRFEWAHIHGLPVDDVWNYVPLCKTCHMFYDSPLTFGDRQTIRQRYAAGGSTLRSLGLEYRVHNTTILSVVHSGL